MIKFSEMSEDQILNLVEPLMENCLEGSNEDNHSKHVRDFTDRLKNIVTPQNLRAQLSNRTHGYFTERQFVALFRKRHAVSIVWKQSISVSDDELVNHAIFVEENGQVRIDHCLIC